MKYCNFANDTTKIQTILRLALSADKSEKKLEKFRNVLKTVNIEKLYEEAKIDEVDSHVAHMLIEAGLPLESRWQNSYTVVEKRITNLMNELERIAIELSKFDIKIVALKNAGITKGIYTNYACSPMGDIDLLIETKNFHQAHDIILKELEYTFKFRSEFEHEDIEEAFRGGGTEYYKDVNGYKVWLELQWRPIAGRWIQPHNEPNGNELVRRAYKLENSDVCVLSPEDNLLQVALHTTKHSYVRAPGFRLHSDVDRIVRFTKIDWNKFVLQVKLLELKTSVYFSLCLSKRLLDTPVPNEVLEQLKPNLIRGNLIRYFLKKAGIFNQKKRKFSRLGYILFNMCLYDNIKNLLTAIIPSPKTIKDLYGIESSILLPFYYVKRLTDLLLKRAKL